MVCNDLPQDRLELLCRIQFLGTSVLQVKMSLPLPCHKLPTWQKRADSLPTLVGGVCKETQKTPSLQLAKGDRKSHCKLTSALNMPNRPGSHNGHSKAQGSECPLYLGTQGALRQHGHRKGFSGLSGSLEIKRGFCMPIHWEALPIVVALQVRDGLPLASERNSDQQGAPPPWTAVLALSQRRILADMARQGPSELPGLLPPSSP